ncbi:MAG TPA: aminotransferase class III-fold pyridoxal phosphate-dependent enzyme [Candidatus Binataceae bacterium]|nr:aminotransferase class III-fold pyridoxal phosphate-dependent enzyme [Candidatus Binataceae bacterium]
MTHDEKFERGLSLMLEAIAYAEQSPTAPIGAAEMERELNELAGFRARPAFYPYLGSGVGRGARAMLADGRWVLDFALGIGVHLFGHGNLDLIETAIRAAAADLVMQGNLIFNREYPALMKTILAHAPAGMDHCWLSLSGADAAENGLKLMRQKRDGRPGVIAFRRCFHGRTSAMAEITDRPDYRRGQPRTFPVEYIPFYDRTDPNSAEKSLSALRQIIAGDGDRIGAFATELVQGEAGFITAPGEFFVPLFEECRQAGIPIWADEIQTFGRVSELFATNLLGLGEYIDVITIAKPLQGSAMLFRKEFTPDPALISGTFSGATVAMAVGRRIIEKLTGEGYLGPDGREKQLERLTRQHLARLSEKYPGAVSNIDGIGVMIAFRVGDGSLKATREFIHRCFNAGLVLYYGGHEPACVRLFVPVVTSEAELDDVFAIIERCLPPA